MMRDLMEPDVSGMKYRFKPTAILAKRCPRCGHPIFRGPLTMNDDCPGCGLDFDRGQPGYFTGAMYISYALAIPLIALLTLIEHLLIPSWSLFRLVLLAWAICVPLIPWVWQYSRVIWIHLDRWVDPDVRNDQDRQPTGGES
jgi:uncharacterized protein (DUF983 family)